MKMRSFSIIALCLAVAAVCYVPTGCSKKGGQADSLAAAKAAAKNIVARVNGKGISQLDFERQEKVLLEQVGSFADSAQVAEMMPMIKKQALDNAINRVLIEHAVNELGITADAADVDKLIASYRGQFVDDASFEVELGKHGMDKNSFRGEVEMKLRADKLFARESSKATPPTDAEILDFYKKNPERFVQGEKVRASHILVKVDESDSPAVRAEKRKKIEGILADLKKGADFAEQARLHSDCPSKEQGGDLGYFERGSMVPEFEKAAFSLPPGKLSGIVETQFGFHIIKVTEHKKSETVPFEKVKQQLSGYLLEQKKNEAIISFFDSLKAASKIEYIDSTLVK